MRNTHEQTQVILSKIDEYNAAKSSRAPLKMIYAMTAAIIAIPLIAYGVITGLSTGGGLTEETLDPNYIETLAQHSSLPNKRVTDPLKWVSWYKPDENSPTAQLYKEKYGVDTVFEHINVSYENRYDVLANMVASDNSPDVFHFEDKFFPYGAFMKLFEPLDNLIDFSGIEWDATRHYVENYRWGYQYYVPVTERGDSTSTLFYRKSVIEANRLPDPYELWQSGQWTWNTFEDMCEAFTDVQSNKYAVMGYYIDEALIASTGTPLIGLKDGLLLSNLDHGNIERATTFMQKLANRNYRYPYHTINNFNLDRSALQNGRVLFWNDYPSIFGEVLQQQSARNDWDISDIGIVPFPADPDSKYHFVKGRHDSLMLVNGAKNLDGFKAWTQCAVLTAQNHSAQAEIRENRKAKEGFTDFQLDVLDEIRAMPAVWEVKDAVHVDFHNFPTSINNLTKPVIMDGESYSDMRDAERAIIDYKIREFNDAAFWYRGIRDGRPSMAGLAAPFDTRLHVINDNPLVTREYTNSMEELFGKTPGIIKRVAVVRVNNTTFGESNGHYHPINATASVLMDINSYNSYYVGPSRESVEFTLHTLNKVGAGTNPLRVGGVYIVPLHMFNGSYRVYGGLDVLFELDDHETVRSNSGLSAFHIYDDRSYYTLLNDIRRAIR